MAFKAPYIIEKLIKEKYIMEMSLKSKTLNNFAYLENKTALQLDFLFIVQNSEG